jgi:F-type H+-transporting ATPase subunit delta
MSSTPSVDAVAHVYARALFELAGGDSGESARPTLEEVAQELEQIVEITRSDRAFREFLTSPIVDKEARSKALTRMFGGRVSSLTARFLLVLNRRDRLGHLAPIHRAYDQLLQDRFGKVEVDVYTATPIAEGQLSTIRGLVHKALGKEPVIHRYVEPEMLGGIRLRIGDRLVDASLAGRIQRMKESILHSGSESLRSRLGQVLDER